MKYVIHFTGGAETTVDEDYVINMVKPKAGNNMFFMITNGKIDKVINLNNITHIERDEDEGYF
jgi:hypothetical protein